MNNEKVNSLVQQMKDQSLLEARRGGFFEAEMKWHEEGSVKRLMYEALDALEKRVEALEQKIG